ncbi:FecR family protein [Paraflavitalea speifideaquila]|uniref:FecR family protein n=1 Tax=Paraflavitalea speifideaquila TaxID=3076558 RepID=UPI0028EBFDD0|nr:FecR family protein [Paraflavitalea speifideiaquila]
MEMDQSLIDKFLENGCSAGEARLVHDYLTHHPEVLKRLYGADWEAAGTGEQLDGDEAEQLYEEISKRIGKHKGARIRYMGWATAAAAAIVLMVWSSWHLWPGRPVVGAPVKAVVSKEKVAPQKEVIPWQVQQNMTKKLMKIKLPDGSVVSLWPAGVIKYETAFAPGKRTILLEGEALFEVVKDKARPFTVSTGACRLQHWVLHSGLSIRRQLWVCNCLLVRWW